MLTFVKYYLLIMIFFTFLSATSKCQQRAQVFQLISVISMFWKTLKKVWFEKAWELTFHSLLKLVNHLKKSMKSWFYENFSKRVLQYNQISPAFNNKLYHYWQNLSCPGSGKNPIKVWFKFSILTNCHEISF